MSLGGQNHHQVSGVFLLSALVVAISYLNCLRLPVPSFYTSRLLKIDKDELLMNPQQLEQNLLSIAGVKEVALAPDEQVAYLKVDKSSLDENALLATHIPQTTY